MCHPGSSSYPPFQRWGGTEVDSPNSLVLQDLTPLFFTAMSAELIVDHHCHPFWKGCHFKDSATEDEFQQKYAPAAVRVTALWAITILCVNIIDILPTIQADVEMVHFLANAPTTLLAIMTLLLVFCYPPKYATLIASIAAVLCSAGRGVELQLQTLKAQQHGHVDLFAALEGDKLATQALVGVVTSVGVHQHLSLYGVQLLLFVALGLSQTTLAALVLSAAGYVGATASVWAPYLPRHFGVVGVCAPVISMVFTLLLGRNIAMSRRREFFLARNFEEALNTAVQAGRSLFLCLALFVCVSLSPSVSVSLAPSLCL